MKNPKSANASSSAETVASIDELLTEILSKLPIKPLIRSKLVSKHWFSLISTHHFCLMRNPNPNPSQGIFVCYSNYDLCRYEYEYVPLFPDSFTPSINLNFTDFPLRTKILHSCNGLLLCCGPQIWYNMVYNSLPNRKLYVFNPTTSVSAVLPAVPSFTMMSPNSATLVFDPYKSPYYKVVFVERVSADGVFNKICDIRIYSSETGTWSDGCAVERGWYDLSFVGSGVYWNGSVHWLNEEFCARNPGNSLRFHVDTRVVVEMPSPPVVIDKNDKSNVYFGESCDHLHFIECMFPRFNVYEMKRDYSEWFVKYKVDLSPFIAEYPEVNTKFINQNFVVIHVLSLVRGKTDNESKLVLRIPNKAMKFNLFDGTWEKLCDFRHHRLCYWSTEDQYDVDSERCGFEGEYGLDYIQSLCSA